MTVGEVLRWAEGRRESGGLFVDGPITGAVYLVDGDISFVTTGRGLPIEQQFVASGVLTREQLPDVLAQVRAGRDLSFVLDAEPGVEHRGAVQVVHDRSVDALVDLLGLTSGTYVLDRYQQHPFGMLGHWAVSSMLQLAQELLLDRLDPAARELLALVPQPTAHGMDDSAVVTLSPVELRLLLGAGDGRPLEEVANRTGIAVTVVSMVARGLVDRGLLRFAPPVPADDVTAAVAPLVDAPSAVVRQAG